MRRCPICDKTFADGMRFCQTDGTVLVDDAPAADPYKTVVGNQSDIASAIPPVDPFKTMIAIPPVKQQQQEEDLLQLPEEPDSLKTLVVSQEEMNAASSLGDAGNVPELDLPPVPIIEPKVATPSDSPPFPKSGEPSLSPPSFGDLSSSEPNFPKPSEPISGAKDKDFSSEKPPSPFDSKAKPNDFSTQSPYGNQENKPIPSPFDGSMIGYQPPAAPPPFDMPKPPPVKEPEPMFGSEQQETPNQSPFQPPSPFGQPEAFNQPMQQSDWTPPPAPMSEWQNQDLGANTPFQPPPVGQGQNQTLPIISLVLGIISLCCYIGWITGPAALVTGYLGMKNANTDPNQYGGKGLAIAGMIVGGLFTLIWVIYWVFIILVYAGIFASAAFS